MHIPLLSKQPFSGFTNRQVLPSKSDIEMESLPKVNPPHGVNRAYRTFVPTENGPLGENDVI
jgi:hypothetical protein